LLKTTMRLINLRPTEQKIWPMLRLAAKLGAQMTDLVQLGDGIRRNPSKYGSRYSEQPWGALINPESERCMILVGQEDNIIGLNDAGIHGRILSSEREITLLGNETYESVFYAVIADSEAQAIQYAVLGNQ